MDVAAPPRIPREVWVLVAGSFVVAIGFGLVTPVLPTFAASFGVNATAVAVIISAFALSRLLFSPVAGKLLNRWSERPIYLMGLAIVALSNIAFAFAPSYGWLVAARSFGGIGSCMFTISSFALLVRVTPPSIRGRASALYASGFLIGNITGPLLGGLLVGVSMKAPFLGYAGALLVAIVVVQLLLGRGKLTPRVRVEGAVDMLLSEALRHPTYRAVLASNFTVGWAVYGIRIALLPLFVASVLKSDVAVAGYALTLFAVGNAIVLPVSGRWSDRVGRKPAVMCGLIVSAVATGAIGLTSSIAVTLLLSVLGGIGSGLITPGQQAAVADVIGSRHGGSVLAGFQMSADIGTVIGSIAAGLIVDASGFKMAFLLAGCVVLLAFLPWLWAKETLPKAAPSGVKRP
ncbi:MFS transporter [Nakamurella antarctica]|uniref:MFS transporter n=1 Tax=Nakamurella antarctica TaxID=1902245 RepID=UPI0019D1CFDE|nr:MFS transporter [Nakamurella antarctica]